MKTEEKIREQAWPDRFVLSQALKDVYANTLRTALGYSTGLFHGLGAYLQLEDVRALGDDTFNDGGANGDRQSRGRR